VVRISHAGREVAVHAACAGRRERAVDPAHFEGVAGARGGEAGGVVAGPPASAASPGGTPAPALLRPLAEYEAAAGGAW
jgi:hypothetical protein